MKFSRVFISLCFVIASLNAVADEQQDSVKQAAYQWDWNVFNESYKKAKYEASLAYTKYTSKEVWWSHLEPFTLYLGALPLKNEGHLEAIKELGVTRVLSVVENFELEDGWFNIPVKRQDWEEQGIEVVHIPAVDFYALKQEEIEQGVEYLADTLADGHTVYVHCKAGRGRSASIVISYLMKYHDLTFEEAHQFVLSQRPQINLNAQQSKAIFDFFNMETPEEITYKQMVSQAFYDLLYGLNEMSEEKLSSLLQNMLVYVTDGVKVEEACPPTLATWIPDYNIQSTLQRRNRYLREYQGDQQAAVEAAIARNHSMIRKLKTVAPGIIPVVGQPMSYSVSLWHQLREITLIAALYGHDIHDSEVQFKILSCLASGDIMKLPAHSIDLIARKIIKDVLVKNMLKQVPNGVVPTHLIFNYFTDNSAHVASYAKEVFGNDKMLLIAVEEYTDAQ